MTASVACRDCGTDDWAAPPPTLPVRGMAGAGRASSESDDSTSASAGQDPKLCADPVLRIKVGRLGDRLADPMKLVALRPELGCAAAWARTGGVRNAAPMTSPGHIPPEALALGAEAGTALAADPRTATAAALGDAIAARSPDSRGAEGIMAHARGLGQRAHATENLMVTSPWAINSLISSCGGAQGRRFLAPCVGIIN